MDYRTRYRRKERRSVMETKQEHGSKPYTHKPEPVRELKELVITNAPEQLNAFGVPSIILYA